MRKLALVGVVVTTLAVVYGAAWLYHSKRMTVLIEDVMHYVSYPLVEQHIVSAEYDRMTSSGFPFGLTKTFHNVRITLNKEESDEVSIMTIPSVEVKRPLWAPEFQITIQGDVTTFVEEDGKTLQLLKVFNTPPTVEFFVNLQALKQFAKLDRASEEEGDFSEGEDSVEESFQEGIDVPEIDMSDDHAPEVIEVPDPEDSVDFSEVMEEPFISEEGLEDGFIEADVSSDIDILEMLIESVSAFAYHDQGGKVYVIDDTNKAHEVYAWDSNSTHVSHSSESRGRVTNVSLDIRNFVYQAAVGEVIATESASTEGVVAISQLFGPQVFSLNLDAKLFEDFGEGSHLNLHSLSFHTDKFKFSSTGAISAEMDDILPSFQLTNTVENDEALVQFLTMIINYGAEAFLEIMYPDDPKGSVKTLTEQHEQAMLEFLRSVTEQEDGAIATRTMIVSRPQKGNITISGKTLPEVIRLYQATIGRLVEHDNQEDAPNPSSVEKSI